VITRLVYRKGVTLLKDVIPEICEKFPNIQFLIGGDGDLRVLLEEVVENNNLFDRVKLLGAIPSHKVRDVLIQGDIFLNCSLTEAFGISIIEAASCGLLIVSTRVGGVPEILPEDMMNLAEPNVQDIVSTLSRLIINLPTIQVEPEVFHHRVEKMYNWSKIGLRTEKVYDKIIATSSPQVYDRLAALYGCGGLVFGKLLCVVMVIYYLLFFFFEWLYPRESIDVAIDLTQYPVIKKE
jgi:phosphatidylinositol glycan class A protein